jgi:pimeloyl-ACP methyl ester carboxylesterase
MGRRLAIAIALVAVLVLAGVASSAPPPGFETNPCPDGVFPSTLRVDCGTLSVPENRSNPKSRTIEFAAAIVHATAAHPKADPIVFLDGGPSFGAINTFAMEQYFADASYVQDRDVILVDTRGEGTSQPRLGCPELDEADFETFYAKPYIGSGFGPRFDDALRACRARLLASGDDLSAYNSAETAADLDALRKALRVKQWNLWAISADGVAGLTYMRLYPGGIRSAVLDSPQSNTFAGGLDYLRGKVDLLERWFAGCAANAACAARYPNIRGRFYDLVDSLQADPIDVTVHFKGGTSIVVHVDGVEFFYETFDRLFNGDPQALFADVWRATQHHLDDYVRNDFGKDAPQRSDFDVDPFSAEGKTESYLCHDVTGFLTQAQYDQAAADLPELAPDILDTYFDHPPGRAGCAIWNNGIADAAQHQPVSSKIPTLITDGEFDLGVPPRIVRQIPPTLSKSFLFEFPAAFHLQLASYNPVSECARSIAAQFLDAPTRAPDSTCIASLPRFDYTP